MSYRYMQAVKIVCDHVGCKTETADLNGEFAFWDSEATANEDWDYGDGICLENGQHFCPDHRPYECAHCGAVEGDVHLVNDDPEDEGDWWCPEHLEVAVGDR